MRHEQADIAKSKRAALSQAKVMRTDGTVEYHYSRPKLHFWELKKWYWIFKRMVKYKQEENYENTNPHNKNLSH